MKKDLKILSVGELGLNEEKRIYITLIYAIIFECYYPKVICHIVWGESAGLFLSPVDQ